MLSLQHLHVNGRPVLEEMLDLIKANIAKKPRSKLGWKGSGKTARTGLSGVPGNRHFYRERV